ncbi:hypothetical protein CTEN210_00526 [Chaetoceros tenuissimus]|uniref:Uncharacterized protein n=1 Tax=Chaetoceros tenuissimus TaxID=426638 RepID=A0AAD3CDF0_9STRA|nr:hypothetical protein CTEN210_00526 [Chaetoceros tenuissimus]
MTENDFDAQYEKARALKENGTKEFLASDFHAAEHYYEEAAQSFEDIHNQLLHSESDVQETYSAMMKDLPNELSKTFSNASECALRQDMYVSAIGFAESSLEWDKNNFKSLFRRAKGNVGLAYYDKAIKDLDILEVKMNNKDVRKLRQEINERYEYFYRIIDSYRLRIEDTYVQTGDAYQDTLYSGECPMPLRHFRAYVRLACQKKVFPPWFYDLYGNNFDIVSEIAENHKFHSIKYAQEEKDLKKYYNDLGKPNEVKNLRKLAVKIQGPILSYDSFSFQHEEDLRRYYSDSSIEDVGNWWQEAPYSPLLEYDYENKIAAFNDSFGEEPPVYEYPRFDFTTLNLNTIPTIQEKDLDEEDSCYDEKMANIKEWKFLHAILNKRFDNTMDPIISIMNYLGKGLESIQVCKQDSEKIQARLIEAVYGGNEDILTNALIHNPNSKWSGPQASDKMNVCVPSWCLEEGLELMEGAWAIWKSVASAREILKKLESKKETSDNTILLGKQALDLPCFSRHALFYLKMKKPYWDASLNIYVLYVDILILTSNAYIDIKDYKSAYDIISNAQDYMYDVSMGDHKEKRCQLQFCKARALVGLKRYRDAENELFFYKDGTLKGDIDQLLLEIKDKRGPLSKREPIKMKGREHWWKFDASVDLELRNFRFLDETSITPLWDFGTYPDVLKLEISIREQYSIEGIRNAFPNLRELIVDDSKECYRCGYDLEDLSFFHNSLTRLELNLSGQWMLEGSDSFRETLCSLKNLQHLKVQRLRDGNPADIKAMENLYKLESIYFEGNNEGYEESDHNNNILDLSMLTCLHSCTFVEAKFCSITEKSKYENCSMQALIVPPSLQNFKYVKSFGYGEVFTDTLLKELCKAGVNVEVYETMEKFLSNTEQNNGS